MKKQNTPVILGESKIETFSIKLPKSIADRIRYVAAFEEKTVEAFIADAATDFSCCAIHDVKPPSSEEATAERAEAVALNSLPGSEVKP